MNLDAVASFAVFADHLNFSAAARQLHISQPALHVKIRKLSEQLERPLYRRAGGALTLTTHGEQVARLGREIQEQTQGFAEQLKSDFQGERISLAAGEGAYLYLLGPAIQAFLAAADGRIRLLTADRNGSIDAVLSGHAQFGVAPLESVPDGVTAQTLTEVGQMLVVPSGHRLARRRRLQLTELSGCELIVPAQDRPHRQMLARLLQSSDVPWKVAVEANGWELMIRFVQMGIGVAVVNSCCKLPAGLIGIPIPQLPTLRYHVFHRTKPRHSTALSALLEQMHTHANHWKSH